MAFPFSQAPDPPYHAVIFSSVRRASPNDGYADMLSRMLELAPQQDGYLGVESVNVPLKPNKSSAAAATSRESQDDPENGVVEIQGITVSYWRDDEAVKGWKRQVEHLHAQKMGKTKWYSRFEIRVCKVERAYQFDASGA